MTEAYLTGTTWAIGDRFRLRFAPGGELVINEQYKGEWEFKGEKVEVKTRRRNIELDVRKDELFMEGRPLMRIPAEQGANASSS